MTTHIDKMVIPNISILAIIFFGSQAGRLMMVKSQQNLKLSLQAHKLSLFGVLKLAKTI